MNLTRNIRPGFSFKKLIADFFMFFIAWRLVHKNRYDVVHAGEEAVFFAMFFRLVYGIPYVYDLDSSIAQQMVEKNQSLKKISHILNLFAELREKRKLTYLLIAHDIGVVRHMCDRIAVMYLGRVVELGGNSEIFKRSLHPYTHALLNAIPTITSGLKDEPVKVLTGEVPSPINIPPGCIFRSRCPKAMNVCKEKAPKMIEVEKGHFVECHLYG